MVAFGDMPNDADAAAGRFGCMMGNAHPDALAVADEAAPNSETASRGCWSAGGPSMGSRDRRLVARECVTEPAPRADSRRAKSDQMWSDGRHRGDEQVVTRVAGPGPCVHDAVHCASAEQTR